MGALLTKAKAAANNAKDTATSDATKAKLTQAKSDIAKSASNIFAKAQAKAQEGLEKAKAQAAVAYDAAKPHLVNAAEKTWAASKAAAAAGKEFCIDVADSSKATTQMALLQGQYRAARIRLDHDKKEFGGKLFKTLQESCGEGDGEVKDGKLIGCLQDGSEALTFYRESLAKLKEHEKDMEEATAEIADLKERIKEAWKHDSKKQKEINEQVKALEEAKDGEVIEVEGPPPAAAPALVA